ncbi:MAG: MBL fold metallo-hydrolase [Chloroflexi bacterium]|nr:MBL fold metallo-hydrolase [Chloroflexota bacterium]
MEVSPGIYQLKVPIPDNPLGFLLAYLVKGDQGYLLVDAGWPAPEALSAMDQQLQDLGVSFSDISTVLITHYHLDHFGLAARVKELSGAKVAMLRMETEQIRPGRSNMDFEKAMAPILRRNGMPESEVEQLMKPRNSHGPNREMMREFHVDQLLEEGDVLDLGTRRLEVLWTPGHSPGHICLYDRQNRVFFSGDHVLPIITPHVSLYPGTPSNPLGNFLSSLAKLEPLKVDLVLPAHEHVFDNFQERLEQIHHHHGVRLQEMLNAMEGEGKTAYEISSKIRWDLGPWKDFSAHDRRSAVTESLAHLEFLRLDGRVAREERDGLDLYQPA